MIRVVLTDIEGTTSSLSYVKEVMFPYSKERLESFLKEHWKEDRIKKIVRSLGDNVSLELAVKTFREWIDRDLKEPALKELQGHIWEEGFLRGELQGHVYEDAYQKLKEWKEKGYELYVYSSGSVKAQELFFKHTNYGDLTVLFSGFFDTSVGNKKQKGSYLRIAQSVGIEPESFLFLSDVEEELEASELAGMKVVLVDREGKNSKSRHRAVRSFYEIEL